MSFHIKKHPGFLLRNYICTYRGQRICSCLKGYDFFGKSLKKKFVSVFDSGSDSFSSYISADMAVLFERRHASSLCYDITGGYTGALRLQ